MKLFIEQPRGAVLAGPGYTGSVKYVARPSSRVVVGILSSVQVLVRAEQPVGEGAEHLEGLEACHPPPPLPGPEPRAKAWRTREELQPDIPQRV